MKSINEYVSHKIRSLEVKKRLAGSNAIYEFITSYLTRNNGTLANTKQVLIHKLHPTKIGIKEIGHEVVTWEGKA